MDPEILKGGAQSIVDTSQFFQWFFNFTWLSEA